MNPGRGRGRGRGIGRSPLLDALAINREEPLPPPILQPPPNYPPIDRRPLDLKMSEADQYLMTVKRDFRHFMQTSPYFVKRRKQERENCSLHYTDVFQQTSSSDKSLFQGWEPNWLLFPLELRPVKVKKRKIKRHTKDPLSHKDLSALDELNEKAEDDEEDEEAEEEETYEYDEQEEEEEGDYMENYNDDGGDDYGGDEDDALEDREGLSY